MHETTIPRPTLACEHTVPEWVLRDELLSANFRQTILDHVEACDFCSRLLAGSHGYN
jgi:hypothetical protein